MVGKVVLEDVAPHVLLRPVSDRVDLPDPPPLVALELRRADARHRLLAADSGDPRVDIRQRSLEGVHLGGAATVRRGPRLSRAARIEHLDLETEPLLEAPPCI